MLGEKDIHSSTVKDMFIWTRPVIAMIMPTEEYQ